MPLGSAVAHAHHRRAMSLRRSLAFALVLTSFSATAIAEPLRLEDAVRAALTANERALKAPLRLEAAEGSVERARAAFLPNLVLGAQATVLPKNGAVSNLTLSQTILSPSAFPLYQQAKHNLYVEKWGAEQDLRQLGFDTAKAFVGTLAAERVLEAAERRLATARANLDYAEARAAAQLASTNDVTRAQVAIAAAQSSVAQATGNVQKAYITLSFLVGKPVSAGLATPEAVVKAAAAYAPADKELKAALDRRFDVKAAHERVEALRSFADEPLYRLAPTLSASAGLKYDFDPIGKNKALDEAITFNLTWQVFDGGSRYGDRRTRLAQAKSAELDESLLRRAVEADVKTALASLEAARKSLGFAETAVAAAQKSVDETQILYQQGLAKAIELTDANLNRFDAEITRESAKVTMQQAYLDLRLALGYGPLDP